MPTGGRRIVIEEVDVPEPLCCTQFDMRLAVVLSVAAYLHSTAYAQFSLFEHPFLRLMNTGCGNNFLLCVYRTAPAHAGAGIRAR